MLRETPRRSKEKRVMGGGVPINRHPHVYRRRVDFYAESVRDQLGEQQTVQNQTPRKSTASGD